ncbi:MAG TPA: hypothetical protein VH744_06035 [Terriglobales bacterium]
METEGFGARDEVVRKRALRNKLFNLQQAGCPEPRNWIKRR